MQSAHVPGFITRQSVLVVVLLLALLFFILALALPWYKITEENVPYPSWSGNETANVISTFYWTGVTISVTPTDAQTIPRPSPTPAAASATPSLPPSPVASPVAVDNSTATNSSSSMSTFDATTSPTPTATSSPATTSSPAPGTIGATTKKKMPWSEFPTGAVEARMMASLGLLLAAVGLNLVLLGPILFAHNLLRARFGHKATKWVLLGVSLAMIICAFLSWFLFFGLCESFALDESYCPDEAYLGLSVFDEEKYWCTTFIGERTNIGTFRTHFQWGPMSGFWLALGGAIVSIVASFFVFILKGPSVEELGQKRPLMHDNDYVSYH